MTIAKDTENESTIGSSIIHPPSTYDMIVMNKRPDTPSHKINNEYQPWYQVGTHVVWDRESRSKARRRETDYNLMGTEEGEE